MTDLVLFMMVTTKGEPFTLGGLIIVHEDRDEMAYLFPGTRVVPYTIHEGAAMALRDHPSLASTTFPLDRKDFRREC